MGSLLLSPAPNCPSTLTFLFCLGPRAAAGAAPSPGPWGGHAGAAATLRGHSRGHSGGTSPVSGEPSRAHAAVQPQRGAQSLAAHWALLQPVPARLLRQGGWVSEAPLREGRAGMVGEGSEQGWPRPTPRMRLHSPESAPRAGPGCDCLGLS